MEKVQILTFGPGIVLPLQSQEMEGSRRGAGVHGGAENATGISRRKLLEKGAVIGGLMLWVVPMVQSQA